MKETLVRHIEKDIGNVQHENDDDLLVDPGEVHSLDQEVQNVLRRCVSTIIKVLSEKQIVSLRQIFRRVVMIDFSIFLMMFSRVIDSYAFEMK